MKHLVDYLNEAATVSEAVTTEKKITFNFKGLENAEETLKSLEGKDGVEIEEEKLTLTINTDNVSKIGTVQDILQQFCQTVRGSEKRTNDEQYAQKTKSFEDKIKEMNDAIDEISNPDDDDDDNDDNDDNDDDKN